MPYDLPWELPLFFGWGFTLAVMAALPFVIVLLVVALSRNRSPWWALLGFFSLPGLAVGLIVLLTDNKPGAASRVPAASSPELIAKERFARGEIDEGELEHILETLRR